MGIITIKYYLDIEECEKLKRAVKIQVDLDSISIVCCYV